MTKARASGLSSGFGTTSANQPPVFDGNRTNAQPIREHHRRSQEHRRSGISATDPEGSTVSYSLAGGDTDQFTIDTRQRAASHTDRRGLQL